MPIVLQLSDPHLLQDPNARLREVPTRQTLHEVLSLAFERCAAIDRVVLTGDLAHDETPATYVALEGLLRTRGVEALPLPGNHDDRGAIATAFPRVAGAGDGTIRFVDVIGGWCLIGLDSQIPGEDAGRLGPDQLEWLRQTLATHVGMPTVIFVHHPPIPTGHPVLDDMGLLDADALASMLEATPWVAAICHGHIHRAFEGRLGSTPVLGAPSTAFQFPAHPDDGPFEFLPPGARVLHLGSTLRTEVIRLPRLEWLPRPKPKPGESTPTAS